ncbi:DUF6624 domain-containing protein [Olivibacter sp. XZL3]|uniref:DUF6624 domain-containing protein n=1 Tax=Olivibacter sp. XZL3 TaxID=1735116 RepID=UPI0010669BF1|nr:DUF6624 domain-containing protein [Olivibacter sp. XZL3]
MYRLQFLLLLVFCHYAIPATAQTSDYDSLVKSAMELYLEKEYRQSAITYSKAFASIGDKGTINDRYNAACSWARAKEIDSAFYHLERIAKSGHYTDLAHISSDQDLKPLHSDPRWPNIIAQVKNSKERQEKNYDKALIAKLDTIFERDQGFRRSADSVYKKFGSESEEFAALTKQGRINDSLNLVEVEKILNEQGWLGADVIGPRGSQTLFIVIQHADLPIQKKYFPLMQEAVAQGKLEPSNFALLQDRMDLREGRKQTYGSQIFRDPDTQKSFVAPLIDPDNVDERRKSVGLQPLAEYVKFFNFTWDLNKYKQNLPRYEEIHRRLLNKNPQ